MRFRAQVARLLCEYLNVPYINRIYEHPSEWSKHKESDDFKDWVFVDLPYLIDGETTVTEMIPIISYIAKTYGPDELMGRGA
jgi:glutathione S-transferase